MKFEVFINGSPEMNEYPFEVVERKGQGHPDTICDLLCEKISFDLSQYYLKNCGKILHYNLDKALLVAGRSEPAFNGGKILEPARLYLGDRATTFYDNKILKLDDLIENSIHSWLIENLRFLRLVENIEWKNEIKPGSAALTTVVDRQVANDTSVGVGYWPLSLLEELVLETQKNT